jgi:hypothetical protein
VENKGCGSFRYVGELHVSALLVSLLKAPHIKQLDFGVGHSRDTATAQEIIDAYRISDTLEDLTLHHWKFGELNRKVWTQLSHHPRLQRLHIRSFSCNRVDLGNALALILSCIRRLQILDFYVLKFYKVTMDVFLAALICDHCAFATWVQRQQGFSLASSKTVSQCFACVVPGVYFLQIIPR